MIKNSCRTICGPELVKGRLASGVFTPGEQLVLPEQWGSNLLQFSGADIFAALLAGEFQFVPAGMYLEFTNNIGAWVEPTVERSGAVEYYAGLDVSPDGDFLRVPFVARPGRSASSASYQGNLVDCLAMTAGTAGVFGKPFSDAAGSYVLGGAIIAVPDWNDRSQDVILCRGYLPTPRQKPGTPSEVVLRWQILCG